MTAQLLQPRSALRAVFFLPDVFSLRVHSSFINVHNRISTSITSMEAAASVIAVLQLSAKVLSYLNDVKDSSKDRMQCAIEASNLHSLLLALRFRLEGGDGTREWYTAVRSLAVENGPLDQFKQALETLCHKMTDGGRLQKAGEALLWKFKKEEITKILTQMERLKSLIGIALENDHL